MSARERAREWCREYAERSYDGSVLAQAPRLLRDLLAEADAEYEWGERRLKTINKLEREYAAASAEAERLRSELDAIKKEQWQRDR